VIFKITNLAFNLIPKKQKNAANGIAKPEYLSSQDTKTANVQFGLKIANNANVATSW